MGRHGGGYPRPQQESRPDGKKILERLSKETGGRFFEASKKHPVDEMFSQIQEELRSQYSLGYTPEPPDAGAGYHKITLTTKKKELIVQARDGYFSGN
jgi:VWFA-related protein